MSEKSYKYSKRDIEELKKAADIRMIIPGLKGSGPTRFCTCPQCGQSGRGKGLQVTFRPGDKKNLAHCFSCGFSLADPISAYMYYFQDDFLKAVEAVASIAGRTLIEQNPKWKKKIKPAAASADSGSKKSTESFRDLQLKQSGLTVDDVTARWVLPDGSIVMKPVFCPGGVTSDNGWTINDTDDDMVIHYLDLEGRPMQYVAKGSKKIRLYFRMRWANPAAHISDEGKAIKYQTPWCAPILFFIPEVIRQMYRKGERIDTLFIQEGEKKAEKACKHGMLSIAIQGIFNIGSSESGVIKELQMIAKKCDVRKIVMIMDSDWNHLSRDLGPGSAIDARPRQFAKAVIKFKDYVQSLANLGITADIYWGHVNELESGEKGIDDLLTGSLKGREDELLPDIRHAMNEHDGKGHFLNIHKISSLSDFQIRDFWNLNDKDKFFELHKDRFKDIARFRFGKIFYRRTSDGSFVPDGTMDGRERIWQVRTKEDGDKKISIDGMAINSLLKANGFRIMKSDDDEAEDFHIIRIEDNAIRYCSLHDIHVFLLDYVLQSSKDRDIHNHFYFKLPSQIGVGQIVQLPEISRDFDVPMPNRHSFLFRNCQVDIGPYDVSAGPPVNIFWKYKKINRDFKRVKIIDNILRGDGYYNFTFSPEAQQCEFLSFLIDTCNFSGKELNDMSVDETLILFRHLANKITSIGYLLCEYKYPSENKAVIAMDGKISEVGLSCGRSGKSIIGVALKFMQPVVFIDGRKPGLESDDFMLSKVNYSTRTVFIDDVRPKFDYERLYTILTSNMQINPKGKARFDIPMERSPKFYITTNHAISSTSDSSAARLAVMLFSAYYNKDFSPAQKFGHHFFSEWDDNQWNLFLNLMVDCVHIYLKAMAEEWQKSKSGIIDAPKESIMKRNLRQQMGEAFFQWAEMKFDPDGEFVNTRLNRQELFKEFHEQFPGNSISISSAKFRNKIEAYAQYAGLHLNIHKFHKNSGQTFSDWKSSHSSDDTSFIGNYDKSNSKEYFTLATPEWADVQPF